MSGLPYGNPYVGAAPSSPTLSQFPSPGLAVGAAAYNTGTTGGTGGSTQVTASFSVAPMPVPANVVYSRINLLGSSLTNAGTGSGSMANMVGFYSLNGGTALSLHDSFMLNVLYSQNSSTAQSFHWYVGSVSSSNSSSTAGNAIGSNFTGYRNIPVYQGASRTLPAGQWWVVHAVTNRTEGSHVYSANSFLCVSEGSTNNGSMLNATSLQAPMPFIGNFSSTTNVTALGVPMMPSSVHTSAITNNDNTTRWRVPFVQLNGG